MIDTKDTKKPQKTRHRSPAYPIIAIDDAIEKLKVIYQMDKRAFTTFDAILDHLGYETKKRSGTSARVVAALRQYGLLEERGKQFRVSDLGWKILEIENGSEEQRELIKEAALNPPIIRAILEHYGGEVPSDTTLRSFLVLEKKFNPDSVPQFIRVLRRTLDIANPTPDDYNTSDDPNGVEEATGGARKMSAPSSTEQRQGRNAPPSGNQGRGVFVPDASAGMLFPIFLTQEKQGTLLVPWEMTKEEWERFEGQATHSLAIAKATVRIIDEPKDGSDEETQ